MGNAPSGEEGSEQYNPENGKSMSCMRMEANLLELERKHIGDVLVGHPINRKWLSPYHNRGILRHCTLVQCL